MTIEQLEQGQELQKDIKEVEDMLNAVKSGRLIVRIYGNDEELSENLRPAVVKYYRDKLEALQAEFNAI